MSIRVDKDYVDGLIATYESAWMDQWRMEWRMRCYTPWPEFFLQKLDEIVTLECELLRSVG